MVSLKQHSRTATSIIECIFSKCWCNFATQSKIAKLLSLLATVWRPYIKHIYVHKTIKNEVVLYDMTEQINLKWCIDNIYLTDEHTVLILLICVQLNYVLMFSVILVELWTWMNKSFSKLSYHMFIKVWPEVTRPFPFINSAAVKFGKG